MYLPHSSLPRTEASSQQHSMRVIFKGSKLVLSLFGSGFLSCKVEGCVCVCVCVRVCVLYVCVCVREREREKEGGTEKEKESRQRTKRKEQRR